MNVVKEDGIARNLDDGAAFCRATGHSCGPRPSDGIGTVGGELDRADDRGTDADNLHGFPMEPKSIVSANSTIPAGLPPGRRLNSCSITHLCFSDNRKISVRRKSKRPQPPENGSLQPSGGRRSTGLVAKCNAVSANIQRFVIHFPRRRGSDAGNPAVSAGFRGMQPR